MPERRKPFTTVRVLAGAGLLIFLASCGWFTNKPPVEADEFYEISATQAVAAGQVVLAHEVGAEVVSVKALQPHISVSAATNGTSTVVAWVGGSARSGRQVQVGFSYSGTTQAPELANAKAYADAAGPDRGSTLELEARVGNAPDQAPLEVSGLDHPAEAAADLVAGFADYRLGDVDADGAVNVLDALKIRDLADATNGTAHELYHSDLDGDYDTDIDDLQLALDKAVNPNLAARLIVKPQRLDFVQLDPDAEGPGLVLVANGGNQPLDGLQWNGTALNVNEIAGIDGQSAALQLGAPPEKGWLPENMSVSTVDAGEASVRLGNLVILVAGQSNASGRGANLSDCQDELDPEVRMLRNDFRWANAKEPLDEPYGQTDKGADSDVDCSFGTRLGHHLHDALGWPTYLIPAAKGGSSLAPGSQHGDWEPKADLLDPQTLFGAANQRAQVSAGRIPNPSSANEHDAEGGPVNVIAWYQGESEESSSERAAFNSRTNTLFTFFEHQLGARIVYVQLASEYDEQLNVLYHAVAELQRQMESAELPMVAAYDLPRSDQRHLSGFAQQVLAERISLTIREHVFGDAVDGTGPRLESISYAGPTITISVDRPLTTGPLEKELFTVWDGEPTGDISDVEFSTYYDGVRLIDSVVVPVSDPETIVITMATATSNTPYVRLMVPPGELPSGGEPSHPAVWETIRGGVPRGADSGLPLPLFGPLAAN